MKVFYNLKYEQWVEFEEAGEISNFSCTCPDFTIRKLKEKEATGRLFPCKHLKEIFKLLPSKYCPPEKDHLTDKQKDLLRQFVLYICENCKRNEEEVGKLQPHRIKRGCVGGEYELRNIKMLCEKCHKQIHSREYLTR